MNQDASLLKHDLLYQQQVGEIDHTINIHVAMRELQGAGRALLQEQLHGNQHVGRIDLAIGVAPRCQVTVSSDVDDVADIDGDTGAGGGSAVRRLDTQDILWRRPEVQAGVIGGDADAHR